MRRRAAPGHFRNPQGISVDHTGNIVVIAGGLTRPPDVQVFHPSGEYRNGIGSPGLLAPRWGDTRQRLPNGEFTGDGDGELRSPYDSAVDGDGRVLILDGHRVKIFDIEGNHLHSFGAAGWAEEDFISPCGLAVDGKKRIIVTDNSSRNPHVQDEPPRKQVKVFDSNGEFQFSFGPLGSDIGQLKSPLGVAVDSKGRIVVAEQGNNRIQIFDPAGEYVLHFGRLGSAEGELSFPFGVAVNGADEIIVADAGNNRVQVFDSSGRYLRQFGSLGTGDGELNFPFHVAVDEKNNILVADSGNDRVQKFAPDGRYASKFGSTRRRSVHALGESAFNFPIGIALDSKRNVIVTDTRNHRVMVLDANGAPVRQFGSLGTEPGQFHFLQIGAEVAVDGNDRIYVVDSGNQRVQVFSPDGEHLFGFGGLGLGEGKFNTPSGITVDTGGRIIVGDGGNSLVQVFDDAGEFLFQFGESGDGDGQFNSFSISVAALEDDRIVAVDQVNQRVQIFDARGEFERRVGTEGTEEGNFRMPGTVNADRGGHHFIVTDPGNERVQIFDSAAGELQRVIAVDGDTCGGAVLDSVVDPPLFLVADAPNDRIRVFGLG
jgi:tripartite motif-containing protein 71